MSQIVIVFTPPLAFEAPGKEYHTIKKISRSLRSNSSTIVSFPSQRFSLSISHPEFFSYLVFLLSNQGFSLYPHQFYTFFHSFSFKNGLEQQQILPIHIIDHPYYRIHSISTLYPVFILIRPDFPYFLDLHSARLSFTFVRRYVTLVTANAYISTLGGGHFLCLHLSQAKRMARLQIQLAKALQDPILASKSRINLAYNAIRSGQFNKANRMIQQETKRVESEWKHHEEMNGICQAADVYLKKTIKLYQEYLQYVPNLQTNTTNSSSRIGSPHPNLMDNYYRQRIIQKKIVEK